MPSSDGVALYARVSSHDRKGDLERQVARLAEWAAERKMRVVRVVKEVGSGLNGKRPGLLSLLRDPQVSVIVVEHRDRLARFGAEYIEAALSAAGRPRSTRSSPRSGRFDTRLGRAVASSRNPGPPKNFPQARVSGRPIGRAGIPSAHRCRAWETHPSGCERLGCFPTNRAAPFGGLGGFLWPTVS